MPEVRFAPAAVRDLARLREYLRDKNPIAARRAAASIKGAIGRLRTQPLIGRPAEAFPPGFRELIIEFGGTGYIAIYRYVRGEAVVALAIRHQREAGYSSDP